MLKIGTGEMILVAIIFGIVIFIIIAIIFLIKKATKNKD